MQKFKFFEDENVKIVRSLDTNYNFNKKTGYTEMWGKTKDDDIVYSTVGPHILDMEISTICNGLNGRNRCKYCYKKSNGLVERNMSLDTFKTIIDKMSIDCLKVDFKDGYTCYVNGLSSLPDHLLKKSIVGAYSCRRSVLSQIAYGSDSTGVANPEVFNMMDYARECGIVPNITVANVSDEIADKFSKVCGAMAISRHDDKDICYDTVKKLTDRGMDQINIHFVVHKYSKNMAIETMKDIMTDPRLSKLNAIVFLSLKKKGNGEKLQSLDQEGFEEIMNFAFENNIRFGMDSCSGGKFIKYIKNREDYDKLIKMVEPCESTKISSYINVDGKFYSCSFCENTDSFKEGIDVVNCSNFVDDVWNHEHTQKWRNNLLQKNSEGCFDCPVFEV